ncbi:hypothetical protein [uncultured Tenacibaculum sp.]|uniref:hypothetical protein n=1 Tax=uncultured Tenacibaculum sp. TaxID=174713 RepID=UPI00261130FE|nr:hypothetical protein [uncultured Tenacibaculum sp.]
MGYELCIKRKEESQKITKEEWSEYIKSDSQFEPIEEFSAKINENDAFTVSTPNAGLWKSDEGEVPFTFYEECGEITVKNPDNRIIEKMILIANELNAIVEGEEGEIYDESYLNDAFSNRLYSNSSNVDKRWWEFWK